MAAYLGDDTIPINVLPKGSNNATLSNVASSISSTTLLANNTNRRQIAIFNDSTSDLCVAFAAAASATSFTVKILAGGYYEMPNPAYTGAISGIWSVANGAARITEMV